MHAREIMRLRIKAQLLHEEILAYCCLVTASFFFHASDCLQHNEMEYLCIEMNTSWLKRLHGCIAIKTGFISCYDLCDF